MRKLIPPAVLIAAAIVIVALPYSAYRSGEQASRLRFERLADDAVNAVVNRIGQHVSLLHATRALFESQSGRVTRAEFATFVENLDISGEYDGIQGIGFAELVPTTQDAAVAERLERDYGATGGVFPETDQEARAVIVMLEPPDTRNRAALGFDMFSNPQRRAAMVSAAQTGEAYASGRVELRQEIDSRKQAGFLVYVPFHMAGAPKASLIAGARPGLRGFVYAPFRTGDLIEAVLSRQRQLPMSLAVYDGAVEPGNLLYQGGSLVFDEDSYKVERSVDVVGRKWRFQVRASSAFEEGPEKGVALLLGAAMLLAAAAVAVSMRAQARSLSSSRELIAVSNRAAAQKDFLLQEMKHRIKNSIARVLAIARQTANHSESLEGFIESYTSRLQAMAASQDLLSRSHDERVGLSELLESELFQVFGEDFANYQIDGPAVELGSTTTQAMGLVFHELSTNALKYADMSSEGNRIDICWRLEAERHELRLDWIERTTAAAEGDRESDDSGGAGFGTRLITSLVQGELGGDVERRTEAHGYHLTLSLPVSRLDN